MQFRKRFIALAAAGLVLGGGAVAGAQVIVLDNDGGPHVDDPPNVETYDCGAVVDNPVKTQNQPVDTSSPNVVPVPGAQFQINVPPNQQRCLKLLFTAESSCDGYAGDDFCYVRALVDGVPMDPDGQALPGARQRGRAPRRRTPTNGSSTSARATTNHDRAAGRQREHRVPARRLHGGPGDPRCRNVVACRACA